ncbi:MAG: hypothetical protein ACLP5H_19355 [Desulfomonilaceae bacterium]
MPKKKKAQNIEEITPAPAPMTQEPFAERGGAVSLVTPHQFAQQIETLRQANTIKDDGGHEVAFEGETKDEFIRLVEEGYPVAKKMMEAMNETGRFLSEVRNILKPKKLFLRWMAFTGFPRRHSYNYLLVHERFGEKLPQFSHLGIRKLLAASHLKDCVEYVEQHEQEIAKEPAEEFEKKVRKILSKKKKKDGRGRKPKYTEIDGCKVRLSDDGTRIAIEGLSKKRQSALFEAIKTALSQDKD